MRFLHLADVHLDTAFAGRSESVRRRLRDASRIAFGRAVDLALRERVHAVLVAGDLFDGDRLSFQTERYLMEQTERLQQQRITVVYATGNHDPGALGGPRPIAWPSNVHLIGDRTPQRVTIVDEAGTPVGYVTAIGHDTTRVKDDLSRLIPSPAPTAGATLPEVGLLHTQVRASFGSEAHGSYAPSELSFLQRSGFDYWALGHVHIPQHLSEDPPVVYAGILQGRTHADQGARGGMLVDLASRSAPVVMFREFAPVRWETVRVGALEESSSFDALSRRVESVWRQNRADDPGEHDTEWMVRIVLEGPCPLWRELRDDEDRRSLAKEIRGAVGALDVDVLADRVHPLVPVDVHRGRVDGLGEALRLLEEVRHSTARLEGVTAADLAGAPGEDSAIVDAYVRNLLQEVDGELVARFMGLDGPSR